MRRRFGRQRLKIAVSLLGVILFGSRSVSGSEGSQKIDLVRPWDVFYGVSMHQSGSTHVVGAKGILLSSPDSGRTWERRQLPFHENLYSIAFDGEGRRGLIAGEHGLILLSEDHGKTWQRQKSPVDSALFRVRVLDADRACAVGAAGSLLWTEDGGQHWQAQQFQDLTFFDLAFVDGSNGWAVGEFYTILRTGDGGKTWAAQRGGGKADFTVPPYFAVSFRDTLQGSAVGMDGKLLVTADGGQSWAEDQLKTNRAVYTTFAGDGLWLAGSEGTLIHRNGEVEQQIKIPTFQDILSIAFSGPVGLAVGFGGTILRTEDGGQRWLSIETLDK